MMVSTAAGSTTSFFFDTLPRERVATPGRAGDAVRAVGGGGFIATT